MFHLKTHSEASMCYLLLSLQAPVVKASESLSVEAQLYVCGGLVLLSFILLILARFSSRLVNLCVKRFHDLSVIGTAQVLLLVPDKS